MVFIFFSSLHGDLTTANAFYNRFKNQFNLQIGILQPPVFDQNYPDSLNYGAVGTIIGHEVDLFDYQKI